MSLITQLIIGYRRNEWIVASRLHLKKKKKKIVVTWYFFQNKSRDSASVAVNTSVTIVRGQV